MTKTAQGRIAETITRTYLENLGRSILEQNFFMHRGELDLVAETDTMRIFVEVKQTNYITDLHNYLTPKKLAALQKTITYYNMTHPSKKPFRLDLVFVQQNTILAHYENITN